MNISLRERKKCLWVNIVNLQKPYTLRLQSNQMGDFSFLPEAGTRFLISVAVVVRFCVAVI